MKTNMKLSQQQRLVLSPQMREYLRLLHLPVAELRQAVDKAIEENPMLEEAASPETAEAPVPSMESTREDERNLSRAVTGDWDDAESINFFKSPTDFSKRPAADMQHLKDFQDSLLTRPESLFNFLEWQIQFLAFTGNDKTIAGQIMGNINEDGYLTATIGEIARAAEALPEDVERVLAGEQKRSSGRRRPRSEGGAFDPAKPPRARRGACPRDRPASPGSRRKKRLALAREDLSPERGRDQERR